VLEYGFLKGKTTTFIIGGFAFANLHNSCCQLTTLVFSMSIRLGNFEVFEGVTKVRGEGKKKRKGQGAAGPGQLKS